MSASSGADQGISRGIRGIVAKDIEQFTREYFVEMISSAGGLGVMEHPEVSKFCEGAADISVSEIEIDSLSRMQLAIDLEDEFGVELGPEFLNRQTSLNDLWSAISQEIKSIR